MADFGKVRAEIRNIKQIKVVTKIQDYYNRQRLVNTFCKAIIVRDVSRYGSEPREKVYLLDFGFKKRRFVSQSINARYNNPLNFSVSRKRD